MIKIVKTELLIDDKSDHVLYRLEERNTENNLDYDLTLDLEKIKELKKALNDRKDI